MTTEEAILPHLENIRRCARRIHNHYRHWSEDDLFSEGVLAAIQAIPRYNPNRKASWETFCLFKAKMGMLDAIRFSFRLEKRRTRHAHTLSERLARRAPPLYHKLQVSDLVELALSVLTPKQERAFRLYFLEGLLMREVASVLGTTESAVSGVIICGLERVRAFMASRQWECPVL